MTDSEKLDEILRLLRAGAGNGAAKKSSGKAGQVADDKLFHGQYGNPEVWKDFDSKDWPGEPMQGKRFSDCSLEWLDAAGDIYDRMAEGMERKGNDKAWQVFQKAALARRWAIELRKQPGAAKAKADLFDDSPPF